MCHLERPLCPLLCHLEWPLGRRDLKIRLRAKGAGRKEKTDKKIFLTVRLEPCALRFSLLNIQLVQGKGFMERPDCKLRVLFFNDAGDLYL